MSRITHNPDIAGYMKSLLPYRWRGATTLDVIELIASFIQPVEDSYEQLRTQLNLNANDYLLDIVGSWVQQFRDADQDSPFRARIIAQIVQNASGGQREDLIEVLNILGAEEIKIWALGGGWLQINYQIVDQPLLDEPQVSQILNSMVTPGAIMVSSYGPRPFGFAGNPSAAGFGVGRLGVNGDCNCGGIEI